MSQSTTRELMSIAGRRDEKENPFSNCCRRIRELDNDDLISF
jgi:hypothetical protein